MMVDEAFQHEHVLGPLYRAPFPPKRPRPPKRKTRWSAYGRVPVRTANDGTERMSVEYVEDVPRKTKAKAGWWKRVLGW